MLQCRALDAGDQERVTGSIYNGDNANDSNTDANDDHVLCVSFNLQCHLNEYQTLVHCPETDPNP